MRPGQCRTIWPMTYERCSVALCATHMSSISERIFRQEVHGQIGNQFSGTVLLNEHACRCVQIADTETAVQEPSSLAGPVQGEASTSSTKALFVALPPQAMLST